ncbi:MAG: TIR domain-containing protein, partial [Anaerolineae bacterium]|nr:TIR domain-containing protein [Anaerolineae bacterium]
MSSDPVVQALDQAIEELTELAEQDSTESAGSIRTLLSGIRADYAADTDTSGSLDMAASILEFSLGALSLPVSSLAVLRKSLSTIEAYRKSRIPGKRLFLSYAWKDDAQFVEHLYRALSAAGYTVWWDRARLVNRGTPIVQELRDAIFESTDRFLPVIGPAALVSEMVQQEWQYARDICLTITPIIRLGANDDVPPDFRRFLWSDFRHLEEGTESFAAEYGNLLRIISKPPHPAGPLFRVPGRPQPFIPRADVVEDIKEELLCGVSRRRRTSSTDRSAGSSNKLLLHGMGGIGKSVITAEVARDCEVRRAFPDGLFWVSLGKNPDLKVRQSEICSWLGDQKQSFADIEEGKARLAYLLQNKACLIILDDVWINNEPKSIDAFDVLSSRSRILVASRETAADLPFSTLEIPLMTNAEAIALLRKWANADDALYAEIVDQLGNLPLGLKLTGARLRSGMSAERWLAQFTNISYLKYNMLVEDDPGRSLSISVQLSVDELSTNHQRLYASLGIFPEDTWFPAAVVKRVWRRVSDAPLSESACDEIIVTLRQLALIEISEDFGSLWLHDLLHDFNRRRLEENDLLEETHNVLLETYNPDRRPWYALPNDGYLYYFLPHHLLGAARERELFSLLARAPQWLARVSQDNPEAQGLVVNILTTYWENNQPEAERFLLRWLSKSRPLRHSIPLAVRGAFSVGFDEGLLAGLRHRDKVVRETA